MPGITPGYHNSAIAAVALLEWSLACTQARTSSIFPSHFQGTVQRHQRSGATLNWKFACSLPVLEIKIGQWHGQKPLVPKSRLCQLASENSARPVEFTVVDVATTSM